MSFRPGCTVVMRGMIDWEAVLVKQFECLWRRNDGRMWFREKPHFSENSVFEKNKLNFSVSGASNQI